MDKDTHLSLTVRTTEVWDTGAQVYMSDRRMKQGNGLVSNEGSKNECRVMEYEIKYKRKEIDHSKKRTHRGIRPLQHSP
jgi:hypothetical protein